MNNIKRVAKFVASNPESDESKLLLELAVALETNSPFPLGRLFEVDRETFKLALSLIEDWRLDRYYLSKLRLLDHAETQSVTSAVPPAKQPTIGAAQASAA